jgi:dipeptidase D
MQQEVSAQERVKQQDEAAQKILDGAYAGLEPREVWRHFAHLNAIPRPSRREAAARAYVERVATEYGAQTRTDAAGNIVVYKSGTRAREGASAVAIQSHLDMVCERIRARQIDWEREGISPRRDGGLIFAEGTTLGADNGLGAAMALALLSSDGLSHPPLELLFTVEEETGLQGAGNLDGSLLSARWLLNLDTEEPDEIVIGCAGGRGADFTTPIERAPRAGEQTAWKIVVGGLAGGHSGIEIHKPLGNAIQCLGRTLKYLHEAGLKFHIAEASGGNARNAIPRDAHATIVINSTDAAWLQELISTHEALVREQWQANEPSFFLRAKPAEATTAPLTKESTRTLWSLLCESPHGVLAWSEKWAGKVETSCNLATLDLNEHDFQIHISGRSFRESALDEWQEQAQVLAHSHGSAIKFHEGYPGWEPAEDSAGNGGFSFLEVASQAFERVAGAPPKIEIVHAGLECGIILSKRPGMEAISFGPLIRGAHTPEENVDIESVGLSWRVLLEVLSEMDAQAAR